MLLEVIMDYKNYDDLYELRVTRLLSSAKIAKMFNVTPKNIDYWIKKLDIPKPKIPRPKKEDNIDIKEVLKLIDAGYLLGEVASVYGVDRNVIKRLVGSHGLNFRNHSTQRIKQSERMKTEFNPTLGKKRPKEVMDKVIKTKRQKDIERWAKIDNYKKYSKVARQIAYSLYKEGELVPAGYVIDHIFSVKDCWENNIPVHIASDSSNLRLITEAENLAKGANSCISLHQFLSKINNSTTIESTLLDGSE